MSHVSNKESHKYSWITHVLNTVNTECKSSITKLNVFHTVR
jgi:hypothetical protein